jgi:hypothetical protein
MAGALVLAAGVPAAIDDDDRTVTIGYLIMRTGPIAPWVRAAVATGRRAHPGTRPGTSTDSTAGRPAPGWARPSASGGRRASPRTTSPLEAHMSFYLSNADTRPTGFEPLEFLDVPDLSTDPVDPFVPVDTVRTSRVGPAIPDSAAGDAGRSIDARAPQPVRRGWARRLRALTTRSADWHRSTPPETGQP